MKTCRLALCSFILTAATGAAATNLQISPVSIFLRPDQQAGAVQLRNMGNEAVYGQVRVFEWDQKESEDVLTPTTEVIASPPIVQVGSNSNQLIRLVRMGPPPPAERTYRILIDELNGDESQQASGVSFRLRYSVPVFVLPARDTGAEVLGWRVYHSEGVWMLAIRNTGGVHAQIGAMQFTNAAGQHFEVSKGLFGYVLPGRERLWKLPLPGDAELAGQLRIEAHVNGKPASATLKAEAAGQPRK
jgi:fimbrial chaperone protein